MTWSLSKIYEAEDQFTFSPLLVEHTFPKRSSSTALLVEDERTAIQKSHTTGTYILSGKWVLLIPFGIFCLISAKDICE